jgi:hypothetical protein
MSAQGVNQQARTAFSQKMHVPFVSFLSFLLAVLLEFSRLVPCDRPHDAKRPAVQHEVTR